MPDPGNTRLLEHLAEKLGTTGAEVNWARQFHVYKNQKAIGVVDYHGVIYLSTMKPAYFAMEEQGLGIAELVNEVLDHPLFNSVVIPADLMAKFSMTEIQWGEELFSKIDDS